MCLCQCLSVSPFECVFFYFWKRSSSFLSICSVLNYNLATQCRCLCLCTHIIWIAPYFVRSVFLCLSVWLCLYLSLCVCVCVCVCVGRVGGEGRQCACELLCPAWTASMFLPPPHQHVWCHCLDGVWWETDRKWGHDGGMRAGKTQWYFARKGGWGGGGWGKRGERGEGYDRLVLPKSPSQIVRFLNADNNDGTMSSFS